MKQNYSSKYTSINSKKLPAIYPIGSKLIESGNIKKPESMLDYGCGRYTDHISEYTIGNICDQWQGYDPNWLPGKESLSTKKDLVICSNVLNVIDSDLVVDDILLTLSDLGKIAVITVYEGNKTGIGKVSKTDCYQRNEKLISYVKRAENLGLNVEIKNGAMIIH